MLGDRPIQRQDRQTLRDLARQVATIAAKPVQARRIAMWTRHNDLERVRPMVLVKPEGAWRELVPAETLLCADEDARQLERELRWRCYYDAHLHDDTVIDATVRAMVQVRHSGIGFDILRTHAGMATGADHFEPVINSMADVERIQLPRLTIDHEATARHRDCLEDLLGDILTVELYGPQFNRWAGMDLFAQLRGLDRIFMDMVDQPELVHAAMERLCQGAISLHEQMAATGLLSLNNGNDYVASGGNGYTRQLPQADFSGTVRSRDLWGFCTTQIFSEVSPAMHEDFSLQYEIRFLERFGLNCYGCCEPLHHKLPQVFKIPNLRRISISPWADITRSAEGLGQDYIFSWKPNPAMVAGESWDPQAIRRYLRDALDRTRGCIFEMILKDTHTCRHQPERMHEWTRIARELAEEYA